MSTYVSLINWTEQGIRLPPYDSARGRLHRTRREFWGSVRGLVWTVVNINLVCVADFPDEEAGVAALLQVGSQGSVRSTTMRAFSSEEMSGIIRRIG